MSIWRTTNDWNQATKEGYGFVNILIRDAGIGIAEEDWIILFHFYPPKRRSGIETPVYRNRSCKNRKVILSCSQAWERHRVYVDLKSWSYFFSYFQFRPFPSLIHFDGLRECVCFWSPLFWLLQTIGCILFGGVGEVFKDFTGSFNFYLMLFWSNPAYRLSSSLRGCFYVLLIPSSLSAAACLM